MKVLFMLITTILLICENVKSLGVQKSTPFGGLLTLMEGNGDLLLQFEEYIPENLKEQFYEFVDEIDQKFNDTRPVCSACKTFVRLLKSSAAIYNWSEIRDPLVEACMFVLTNQSDVYIRADVICPGAIDIQGPHVYEIVRPIHGKSALDICISINACLPPPRDSSKQYTYFSLSSSKQNDITQYGAKYNQDDLDIKKQAAMKVIQLTDIHIEPEYAEGSSTECGLYVCCDDQYGPGTAGPYGDYRCNIPQRTVELFLSKAAEMNPDFIIYSGDTPPHTFWDETPYSQLNCTAILTEAMSRILSGYNIYPNLGNHEMFPTNLYSMTFLPDYTIPMTQEYILMWDQFVNFTYDSIVTMAAGGYYTELVRPGLRVLSINTNYWFNFNWYNILHEENEIDIMMGFIQNTLQLAQENGEKIILVGHHPPGGDTIIRYTRQFENLLTQYSDIIVLHVAGHTHNDHYKVFSDNNDVPVARMFISPSITTKGDVNPSLRVYYIDAITYELIDYEQHGFILEDIDDAVEPEIELWYSASIEYDLVDMSPISWKDLSNRMQSDDEIFAKYYNNHVTRFQNVTCDETCKREQICGTWYYSYDEYVYCVEDIERAI